MQAPQALASGIHAIPDVRTAFAATQAAYRFWSNSNIQLRDLIEPLVELTRQEAPLVCDGRVLIVHDWSQLQYAKHGKKKKDMARLTSRQDPDGYELLTTLAVSDRDGLPIAPVAMSLRAADGVHCTREWQVREALSPLDELQPAMQYVAGLNLGPQPVHIIDAEADSVAHYRDWDEAGYCFLVRADDRYVEWEGQEQKCEKIRQKLREQGAFRFVRTAKYKGKSARQYVAEVPVRLLRAGQRNRPGAKDRKHLPGRPLPLRLVLSELRDEEGSVLAHWRLLTNLPEQVVDEQVALWYYWRWSIEEYFKLLKSAGMNVEEWQQRSAHAVAARLLVASMACAMVWRLARSEHEQADDVRKLLVKLSGRQMKRSKPFTIPALLAGLWVLLSMLEILETYTLDDLRTLAALIRPDTHPP